MSLPRLFKTRLETIPADVPYLRAPAEAAQRWKTRLAKMTGFKIGIVWAGNPEHVNDHRRSLDLAMLAPLFARRRRVVREPAIRPARGRSEKIEARQRRDRGSRRRDFDDFVDTAAAVDALDLVITVDTSVAHLAGALGKPVWVLLPWVTDWRWHAQPRGQSLVSDHAAVPPEEGRGLGRTSSRAWRRSCKAVAQGDNERLMPFKAEGERRAAEAAAIMAAEAVTRCRAEPVAPLAQVMTPGQALILAEQKRRHGFLGRRRRT